MKKKKRKVSNLQLILQAIVKIFKNIGKGIQTFNQVLQVFLTNMRVKRTKKMKVLPWSQFFHLALFSFVFIYYEILLRIFNSTGIFQHLIYPVLFGITAGLAMNIFTVLFSKKTNWKISSFILGATGILFITECLVKKTYQVYMSPSSLLSGAGGVVGNYTSELFGAIFGGIPIILCFLLPCILYVLLGRKFLPAHQYKWPVIVVTACFSLVLFGFSSLIASTSSAYSKQYEFGRATETFGLLTSIRLDNSHKSSSFSVEEEVQTEEEKTIEEEDTTVYEKNVLNIDLDSLIASDDDTYRGIDEYVNSLSGTSQNKYTGIFKDKNLILVCAEAFSDAVIDKELTPTLYRMSTKGISFTNYYQPTWGGSTSTGEYSFLTGLVPTEGVNTVLETQGKNNYFTLPNQLQRLGYYTGGYHNSDYDYYDRNLTHMNLGLNYWLGQGNGIEDIADDYPTDEEMFAATLDTYVDFQPFCMYYMTVGGHAAYVADSWKTSENWEHVNSVVGDKYTDTVKYYLCYQYELEKAMATLIQKLEDAGIANDTVICLTADHYPYGLSADAYGNGQDYVADLYGADYTYHYEQDRNSLILWSTCLEKGGQLESYQCTISDPTYSLDIVPTLSNLFGLEYDSRMVVGRDVFAKDGTKIVVWNDYSWISDKGYYSSGSDEFINFTDEKVDQDYIDRMNSIAQNKVNYSQQVLATDYYAHIFGPDDVIDSTPLWEQNYKKTAKVNLTDSYDTENLLSRQDNIANA